MGKRRALERYKAGGAARENKERARVVKKV